MQKITIIWWSDGFWKWLAWFILKNFRNEVELTITWRNEEKLKKVWEELKCNYTSDTLSVISNSDITIFAVPIAYTEKIIEIFAPYLKIWSMVLDVTSIKKWPSEALVKFSPKWVLVLPTHPMFGPFISTIAGQIFVLCPVNKKDKLDKRYIFLKDFLIKSWAKIVEETAKEHDKMMAIVQWLTHFNMFVLADTMKNLKFDINKSFNFVSPIYKLMISSVWRYVWQNPKLYWDIQMNNTEVLTVHKEFMKSTEKFNKYVEEKDEDSFIENIEKSAQYFWENTKEGQNYTDKIIFMLWKQIELAEKNIWKEIVLENIHSRDEKLWILEKLENRKLYMKNWEILEIDEWNIL